MDFLKMAWISFKGQRAAFRLDEFLLLETGYPFLTLVFHCVLAAYAYGTGNIIDWIVGNAFLLCTHLCVFSLGNSFTGERYFGRIRSIITGKKSKIRIILEKGFFPGICSVITTFTGFLAGCLCFQILLDGLPFMKLLLVFLISMFAAMGFGCFLSIFGLISNQMHFLLNTVEYVLLIFTGSNFPVSRLPEPVRIVSNLLPFTRGIEAARQIMSGESMRSVAFLLAGELAVGAVYLLAAAVLIQFAEKAAIRQGTFDLF